MPESKACNFIKKELLDFVILSLLTNGSIISKPVHWFSGQMNWKVFFNRKGSSCPKVFHRKSVFENFAIFTGKHLCQGLFFNKLARLRPVTLLKKRIWHRCFPINFAKFLRTPFLYSNTSFFSIKQLTNGWQTYNRQ